MTDCGICDYLDAAVVEFVVYIVVQASASDITGS